MSKIDILKTKLENNKLEQGLFTSTDENGRNVIVLVFGDSFEIRTTQDNGWCLRQVYDYDRENNIWTYSEIYE